MPNNYPISGKLITKAIRAISVNTGISINALDHMYATQLGYSLATIKAWKTGKSRPLSRDAIWIIARDGIEKGKLPKEWLLTFADDLSLPAGLKSELLQALIITSDAKVDNKIARKKLSVFLCHSSYDKDAVRDLFRELQEDGVDPWLDEVKLLAGQDWDLEIRRAVQNSDAVVICLSNQSISKEGYVQKEIKIALDIADEKPQDVIFLIPIRLDECDPPFKLQKWQRVDLFKKDGYTKLIASLRKRAQQLGRSIEKNNTEVLNHDYGNPTQRTFLLEVLSKNFDPEKIQEICFRLHIDYDNLAGKTSADKIMELILYCERVNRLDDLDRTAKAIISLQ